MTGAAAEMGFYKSELGRAWVCWSTSLQPAQAISEFNANPNMKIEGKGAAVLSYHPRSRNGADVPAFIVTGGAGSIGGSIAREVIAKGGIAVVGANSLCWL